jgi:hypothetical protein
MGLNKSTRDLELKGFIRSMGSGLGIAFKKHPVVHLSIAKTNPFKTNRPHKLSQNRMRQLGIRGEELGVYGLQTQPATPNTPWAGTPMPRRSMGSRSMGSGLGIAIKKHPVVHLSIAKTNPFKTNRPYNPMKRQ